MNLFRQSVKNLGIEKLNKVAENYRKAQLSLFKAKIHVTKEEYYRQRLDKLEFDTIEKDIQVWENKTTGQILKEFINRQKLSEPEL